jgi:hypothetical protein
VREGLDRVTLFKQLFPGRATVVMAQHLIAAL